MLSDKLMILVSSLVRFIGILRPVLNNKIEYR